MDCKKCRASLPEGANFCPSCGKPVAPPKRRKRKRATGSGSIKKLSGNRSRPYVAYLHGTYIGQFATYKEADTALAKISISDLMPKDNYNATFAEVYAAWYAEKERMVSKSQAGCYRSAYARCEALKGRKFRSITTSEFQRVIMSMEQAGMSKSSCEKAMQLFGQMSAWAVREGIIASSHAEGVKTAAAQKSEREPFTREQVSAILASSMPAAQIATILCATGCRPGELFAARVQDCRQGYFIGGSKSKAGRNRIIAVAPFGLAAYRSLLGSAIAAGSEVLGGGYQGNSTVGNFGKRDFAELMDEIGAKGMTPYNCRHTFATLMVEAGIPKKAIQMQLGHSTTAIQDTYEHPETAFLLDSICRISL